MVDFSGDDPLQTLTVTPDDIEAQTGLTTNAFFIGSALGGVYRLSVCRQPRHWLRICATELIMLAFMGMLSIPIGLALLRDHAPAQSTRFVWIGATTTTLMFSSWHVYLWQRSRSLQGLMGLLDDIDQYNQLIETVILLNQLSTVNEGSMSHRDQSAVWDALSTSRTSLMTGLKLESLMRRHHRFLHRSQTLWLDLDRSLLTLQTLELQDQAQEYQDIVNEALQISIRVQTTMQQLSSD